MRPVTLIRALLILCSSGTARGVVGFKGCSSSSSYPAQISYLVSPPGVSIASYSRVCRSYLCNNLTSLQPFVKLKASAPKSIISASRSCPTCVGEHTRDCLPNFVTTDSCPLAASTCYSSTLKLQAGERKGILFIKCLLCQVLSSTFTSQRGWWDPEVGLGLQGTGCMNSKEEGEGAWCLSL